MINITQNERNLENIEKAISAIENGAQQYTIGPRSLTRGNLQTYYNERRILQAAVAAEKNEGVYGAYVAAFDR